jgi:hypothetical protein
MNFEEFEKNKFDKILLHNKIDRLRYSFIRTREKFIASLLFAPSTEALCIGSHPFVTRPPGREK